MNKQLNYLKIIFIAILSIFISCKQKESNQKNTLPVSDTEIDSVTNNDPPNETHQTEQTSPVNEWLEPAQIPDEKFNIFIKKSNYKKQINSYYNTKYEKVSKDFKKSGYDNWARSKNYIKRIPGDSILQISYMATENKSYDIPIVTLWIPLIPNNADFIFGDINNDQKEDCLISLHSEGGWNASNASNNDIFIFLNKKNNYKLTYVFTSSDSYNPVLIENNQIIANELSYAPEDPMCCPTLYRTDTTNLDKLKDYLKIIN